MTTTMSDIPIGPWLRNIANSQPMTGRSVSSFGGRNGEKLPAPAGDVLDTTVYRYAVRPPAAMLMIVPLMIWSALTEILSQAWRSETSTADATAIAKAMRSTGVIPKKALGSDGNIGARITPASQPTKAAVNIIPSMPMLTTPDRSHITPHSAASPIGTADWRIVAAFSGRTLMRYPASWKSRPATGSAYSVSMSGSIRWSPHGRTTG